MSDAGKPQLFVRTFKLSFLLITSMYGGMILYYSCYRLQSARARVVCVRDA